MMTASATGTQQGAVPRLVFPLVAKTDLWDNYGDPRPNGRHAGIDLENRWRAPLGADIAPALSLVSGPTLRALNTPVADAAFTLKANASPEAIAGAPGELVLGRVAPAP